MSELDLDKIVSENNRLLKEGFTKTQIATLLNYKGAFGRSTLSKHLKKAEEKGYKVDYPKNTRKSNLDKLSYSAILDKNPSVEKLWEKRLEEFKRNKSHEESKQNVIIKVNESKPIGLLLFGDPHIDDPCCDVERLLRDVELCESTLGMYGINIGDATNNWVGYLAKLYSKQETTQDQSYILLEDLIKRVPWLFTVSGNHDMWNNNYASVLNKMHKVLNFDDEVSVRLQFNNGREFKIHSRHNYQGNSQWNSAQGIVKWAKTRGTNYDLLIGGHKHTCCYNQVVSKINGNYHIYHCEQLGSYKRYDDYAISGGFEDTNVSPSILYILNPNESDPDKKISRFTNIEQGTQFLKMIRGD